MDSAFSSHGADGLLFGVVSQTEEEHTEADGQYSGENGGEDADSVLDSPNFAFHLEGGLTNTGIELSFELFAARLRVGG